MLEKFFKLKEHNTNFKTEVLAGATTFMTMAYIIFVNPNILKDAGLPFEPTVVSTCLVAAIVTIMIGVFTNYPFALAAGMGLNAFLVYGVVIGMKVPWQVGMGMIFIEGIIIAILVLTNFREAIMDAIPMNLKKAIGVGIGLFIVFIGLKDAGIVTGHPVTFVALGNIKSAGVLVATIGIFITALLIVKKIKGALLYGIILTSLIGMIFKNADGTAITSLPKIIFTDFSQGAFSTIGHLDILGALKWNYAVPIFSFLISDFFDTMGTVILIAGAANFLDAKGKIPRLKNVLLIDSLAAVLGGFFCSSSATTYIESVSGVTAGGRTGLTSVVTGIFFILAIFIAPLIGIVPIQAIAPALIIVGFLMMSIILEINFNSFEEGFPAFLTLITIPLTFSISNGIGIGFISYTVIKLLVGKAKDVHLLMYIATIVFIIDFILK
ncbi:MAG: NCS2 family permease [Ignavibacteriales bacterium]|nr:NCS2 family permease [Ignavibacteriales bacterium]